MSHTEALATVGLEIEKLLESAGYHGPQYVCLCWHDVIHLGLIANVPEQYLIQALESALEVLRKQGGHRTYVQRPPNATQ